MITKIEAEKTQTVALVLHGPITLAPAFTKKYVIFYNIFYKNSLLRKKLNHTVQWV